ncbi:AI-2E family transporter [Paenibacillus sp. 1001270B_150601_E10]|uniref:AI-2E family transporter n=1 Tax=Paenibacillus sp. 1001270B_150601_E10 TaxID=2787079 RepID=UPI00189C6551|nr:AI-2E family transporter [Paenibacillus sp. 1001270B_150601_E10]
MENKKKPFDDIKRYLIIATYTVVLYLLLTNLNTVKNFILELSGLLNPVLLGIAIAYVLNILMKLYEERIFAPLNRRNYPVWNRFRRPVSLMLTYITTFVVFILLAWFILPQLFESLSMLMNSIPSSMESVKVWIEGLIKQVPLESEALERIAFNWNEIMQKVGEWMVNIIPYVLTFTKNFTSSFINVIMGLMLSAYLLLSKENIIRSCKKLLYAFLPKEKADKTVEVSTITNKAFSGFIAGQLTEALILGCLCFIGMTLFSFPYALLISVIVGVTSVIPIFGAYIGTIPSAFIILMIDPPKAFWFIIFILVLQQIEGNLIYPKVVGNSIGLSGVWVLMALLIGGSLFGLMGMLLGIPAFAVLYTLLRTITNKRLKQRKIHIE